MLCALLTTSDHHLHLQRISSTIGMANTGVYANNDCCNHREEHKTPKQSKTLSFLRTSAVGVFNLKSQFRSKNPSNIYRL